MLRAVVITAAVLLLSPAHAQPADPAFLQRVVPTLQAQRNQALDAAAAAEARVSAITEELGKAQARIRELEAATAAPKPDATPDR